MGEERDHTERQKWRYRMSKTEKKGERSTYNMRKKIKTEIETGKRER